MSEKQKDDFRTMVAAYPKEPRLLVSEVLYARGSLSRETRRQVVTMLKDLQIIIDVARDPDDALVFRVPEDAASSTDKAA